MVDYFVRIAAWLSQGVNCILLGGLHDQTVSARAYLNQDKKIGLITLPENDFFSLLQEKFQWGQRTPSGSEE